jgi:hypothetical protein
MKYIPQKNNKTNAAVSLAMLALFLVSVTLVKYFDLPDSIWHAVFFLCAVTLSLLATKFFLPEYAYYIDRDAFVISKTVGKKTVVECNIDLSHIVAVFSAEEFKAESSYNVKNIYNYNTNFIAPDSKVLIFEYNNFCEAVRFEPSLEFALSIDALIKSR